MCGILEKLPELTDVCVCVCVCVWHAKKLRQPQLVLDPYIQVL